MFLLIKLLLTCLQKVEQKTENYEIKAAPIEIYEMYFE